MTTLDELLAILRERSWGGNVMDTLARWDKARWQAADALEAAARENERLTAELAHAQKVIEGYRAFYPGKRHE